MTQTSAQETTNLKIRNSEVELGEISQSHYSTVHASHHQHYTILRSEIVGISHTPTPPLLTSRYISEKPCTSFFSLVILQKAIPLHRYPAYPALLLCTPAPTPNIHMCSFIISIWFAHMVGWHSENILFLTVIKGKLLLSNYEQLWAVQYGEIGR